MATSSLRSSLMTISVRALARMCSSVVMMAAPRWSLGFLDAATIAATRPASRSSVLGAVEDEPGKGSARGRVRGGGRGAGLASR